MSLDLQDDRLLIGIGLGDETERPLSEAFASCSKPDAFPRHDDGTHTQ